MPKKILIIAPNDKHLYSFITHLNHVKNDNYKVDHFALSYNSTTNLFSSIYNIKKHFPPFFYKTALKTVIRYIDLFLSFKQIREKYDLINIHFVTFDSFVLLPLLKRKGKKIALTPWGSDVLRVSHKMVVGCLKKLYKSANYVTLGNLRFRQDVIKKFDFDPEKIVDLSYGASMIDYIAENVVSTLQAKKIINLEDSFIITAGYNRNPSQNHLNIIQAVVDCREKLPNNLVMLFPFTYNGGIEPYKTKLITLLDKYHIKSVFYENFLESEDLRNIVYATDIFIHAQDTDANSASLQEYLLAGKAVINGEWLKYSNLEKISYPYYLAKNIDSISLALQELINNEYRSKVESHHIEEIKKYGWKIKAEQWNHFYSTL